MGAHPTAERHEWPIELIPVIDVMAGRVVRAQAGRREHYQAIQSPLAQGSDPISILEALLLRSQSQTAYMADLDAIMHDSVQWTCIQSIATYFPDIQLWLDAGFTGFAEAFEAIQAVGHFSEKLIPVLGTESLICLEDLSQHPDQCVLSLDFGPEGFRGKRDWLIRPDCWPDRVIVMTLAQVGGAQGPDYPELKRTLLQSQSQQRPIQIFAAGGVGQCDAKKLHDLGVTGALVATALHTF